MAFQVSVATTPVEASLARAWAALTAVSRARAEDAVRADPQRPLQCDDVRAGRATLGDGVPVGQQRVHHELDLVPGRGVHDAGGREADRLLEAR